MGFPGFASVAGRRAYIVGQVISPSGGLVT